MEKIIKYIIIIFLIFGFIVIPIGAWLDYEYIKAATFKQYLVICGWEYLIFIIGFLGGWGTNEIIKKN